MIQTILAQVDPATGSVLTELFQQYGITGVAFGALLMLMMRQNKAAQIRIENLEKQQQEQHANHIKDQKEMIGDYMDLVKNKTRVLSDLTNCINAMKEALQRVERK